MLDKIFLTLFGLEWFGFGVLGLFFPDVIAGMLGVTSYSESNLYLNETRALYAFFTILGLMSLMSIFNVNLRKKVYLTFAILMGSFLIGRLLSFGLDGSFYGTSALIFVNELIVFLIAYWRYSRREFIF
tara:strand:+ start:749 stop:1135 length:387 start_codon:yes stop_codon:yes gene_type:complete